jgi:hypothetical protein
MRTIHAYRNTSGRINRQQKLTHRRASASRGQLGHAKATALKCLRKNGRPSPDTRARERDDTTIDQLQLHLRDAPGVSAKRSPVVTYGRTRVIGCLVVQEEYSQHSKRSFGVLGKCMFTGTKRVQFTSTRMSSELRCRIASLARAQ